MAREEGNLPVPFLFTREGVKQVKEQGGSPVGGSDVEADGVGSSRCLLVSSAVSNRYSGWGQRRSALNHVLCLAAHIISLLAAQVY